MKKDVNERCQLDIYRSKQKLPIHLILCVPPHGPLLGLHLQPNGGRGGGGLRDHGDRGDLG